MCLDRHNQLLLVKERKNEAIKLFLKDLHLHIGSFLDHWQVFKHCLVLSPTSLKPSLQEYVAVEPLIRDWKLTAPFSGAVRGLQVIAVMYNQSGSTL